MLLAGACSQGGRPATAAGRKVSPSPAAIASPSPSVLPTPAAVPQQTEAALPVPRQEVASAAAGLALFVIGGFDAGRRDSNAVFVYTGSWNRGPDFPVPVDHASAANLGGTLYVAGGNSAGRALGSLFRLEEGGWTRLSPMRHPRGALALVAAGGRLFALGGLGPGGEVAAVEAYDPATNGWSDITALPQPRDHGAGFAISGMACLAGGRFPTTARVDCYDPGRDAWSRLPDLPGPTSGAGAAVLGSEIVVAGGENAAESTLVDRVFRLQGGSWSEEPMLNPRHGVQLAFFGGRAWACGGATAAGYQAAADCTSIA
jgi:hypothetical protein